MQFEDMAKPKNPIKQMQQLPYIDSSIRGSIKSKHDIAVPHTIGHIVHSNAPAENPRRPVNHNEIDIIEGNASGDDEQGVYRANVEFSKGVTTNNDIPELKIDIN